MELPGIASEIGSIDDNRMVYIEDYALQYLKILKQKEQIKADKYILYGKKEKVPEGEVYIIYGVCRPEEESSICFQETGKAYERIGSLDTALWEQEEDDCSGILTGTPNGEQPVRGYYIFYDADDKMKDYLSNYYEESISRSRYITQKELGKAELVALSSKEQEGGASLYLWIRIAVIGILIVFCAIAVTTINGYDKISDFVQTAVRTSEMIEEP